MEQFNSNDKKIAEIWGAHLHYIDENIAIISSPEELDIKRGHTLDFSIAMDEDLIERYFVASKSVDISHYDYVGSTDLFIYKIDVRNAVEKFPSIPVNLKNT